MKHLIIFFLFTQLSYAQLLTLAVDPSRLVENKKEFDSGLNAVATLTIDTEAFIEPFLRVEVFPSIDFIKTSIGGFYVIEYNYFEFAVAPELSLIHRQKPNLDSWGSWLSYGLNFEVRYYITDKIPIILSNNNQRRTDFEMYNTKVKTVSSVYIGVGYKF